MPGTFSRHWFERKPLVGDSGMNHGTCVMRVPWCMSGSLTRGGGENVPGVHGACATRNVTDLSRGPWHVVQGRLPWQTLHRACKRNMMQYCNFQGKDVKFLSDNNYLPSLAQPDADPSGERFVQNVFLRGNRKELGMAECGVRAWYKEWKWKPQTPRWWEKKKIIVSQQLLWNTPHYKKDYRKLTEGAPH